MSWNSLHKIENINPCSPFAKMRVFSPRPSRPRSPSCAMTASAAATYPMRVSCTCRYVFTTRSEFDTESDTTDATNPMNACRSSFSPSVVGAGRAASR